MLSEILQTLFSCVVVRAMAYSNCVKGLSDNPEVIAEAVVDAILLLLTISMSTKWS
jgi:hypothetical protein